MISIAITTRNRPEPFWKVLKAIEKHTQCDYQLIVVDDASDEPYCNADYRFETRSGIPAAKNKCLELAKYDHIFLFDDDTYPIVDGWYLPYMNSGKNHLCYTFLQKYKEKDGFTYHQLGNGCMMYFTRKCLEIVGGFDWNFGLGKYEHVNLSRRIFNAGLTDAPFMDVMGSGNLIYCMDQSGEIERSFTPKEMREQLDSGREYHRKRLNNTYYVDYAIQSTKT